MDTGISSHHTHPLKILPLGGLGEIGLNMLIVEYDGNIIIIDAGSMFPEDHMFGIDIVIPDFSYLRDHRDKIKGILLTHGHEDHIGALPYLLKELPLPIYGTRFTLALVEEKLLELNLKDQIPFNVIEPRQVVNIPPFSVEFIRVCHSIIHGVGLAITTPVGTILHSGDFKLDFTATEEEQQIDLMRFYHYGKKGVLLLLSDSTNVEREGFSLNEQEVATKLEKIFRNCQGRIIISVFASNIQRVKHIIKLASKLGRKVLLNGRSMVANVRIAQNLGIIDQNNSWEIKINELKNYPDDKILMLTTGSQGEPMSALARMAYQAHSKIKIKPGDTVILSSKFIPGNENTINKIINNLFRQGAEVIYEKVEDIHASGHANREELKIMLNITKPRFFIPIHGEYRHLVKHIQLARDLGLKNENTILAEDGDIIELTPTSCQITGKAHTGRIFVDGKGVGDVCNLILKERRILSEDGIVIINIIIDSMTGELLVEPQIESHGFVHLDTQNDFYPDIKEIILNIINEETTYGNLEHGKLKDRLRREIRKHLKKTMGRLPIVFPIVTDI